MIGGEFLAIQPHIWIVPIVLAVVTLIFVGSIMVARLSYEFSGWHLTGFISSIMSGFAVVILLIVSIVNLIPFDSKYWNYYTVTGTIDSYTNGLDEGTGQFTGVPIFTLEGSNTRYVSGDSRLAALQGQEVTMRCDIAWRPYGSDVYSCALGPGVLS